MFTFTAVHEETSYDGEKDEFISITIDYISSGVKLRFSPENLYEIPSSFKETDEVEWTTTNGVFLMSWNPDSITFHVGKYGDGQGGDLEVTVPNSDMTMRSFRDVIDEWIHVAKKR